MSQINTSTHAVSPDALTITASAAALAAFLIPVTMRPDWGPVGGLMAFACTAVFVALTVASVWRRRDRLKGKTKLRVASVGLVTVASASMLAWASGDGLPALLVLLVGAGCALRSIGAPSMVRPLVAAVSVVVALRLIDDLTLFSAHAADAIRWCAAAVTPWGGEPVELLGWTGRGVEIWLGSVALAMVATAGRSSGARCLIVGAAVLVSAGIILPAGEIGDSGLMKIVMLTALLTAVVWFGGGDVLGRRPSALVTGSAAAAAVAAAIVGFHLPIDGGARPRSAVVLAGAFAHEQPTVASPVAPKGADMGSFFHWLGGAVDTVDHVETIGADELRDKDLLVMVNLSRQLAPEEIDAVDAWVRAGGRLFFLGDHTDIFGVMRFSNPLLERFGVSLKFDSAIPFKSNWRHVLRTRWSRAAAGTDSGDLIRISVGATMGVRPPARPLIVARSGYADMGDRGSPQRAFLGNWSYDRGAEATGDLILAADAEVGSGRVMAFGDTAILQQTSFSQSWTFVESALRDLSHEAHGPVRSWIAAALIGGVAVFVLLHPVSIGALLVLLLMLGSIAGVRALASSDMNENRMRPESVAWIHTGMGSNLAPVSVNDNEVEGFATALRAAGHSALLQHRDRLPDLAPSDLVVKPSGAARLSPGEQEELEAFCARGGTVLAVIGPDDADAHGVLQEHGIRVRRDPAGACPGAEASADLPAPSFRWGWPMSVDENTVPHSVLVSAFGDPVVIEVPMGAGRWIWISDPRFIWDQNFNAGKSVYKAANFRFISGLLKRNG